jgi:hypothetical protein
MLLALLPTATRLVILDVQTGRTLAEIQGAGGHSCQEVLFDVSQASKIPADVALSRRRVICVYWDRRATRGCRPGRYALIM